MAAGRKSGNRRRVAIKALRDCHLLFRGEKTLVPNGFNLEIDYDDGDEFSFDGVIVVKNWESFDLFHMINFSIEENLLRHIVVYWGDEEGFSIGGSQKFVEQTNKPVRVFCDFDPFGLADACSLKNFAGFVLPPVEKMPDFYSNGFGDFERFSQQEGVVREKLDACVDEAVRPYWDLMKKQRQAISQDRFFLVDD